MFALIYLDKCANLFLKAIFTGELGEVTAPMYDELNTRLRIALGIE
jgi:hypothetical protein